MRIKNYLLNNNIIFEENNFLPGHMLVLRLAWRTYRPSFLALIENFQRACRIVFFRVRREKHSLRRPKLVLKTP